MGFPHEAMVDMTGGITEVLTVASLPKDLAAFLKPILAKGALINCANCQVCVSQLHLSDGITFLCLLGFKPTPIIVSVSTLTYVVRGLIFPQGPLEQRNEFGILFRHAYSVTGLENVRLPTSVVKCTLRFMTAHQGQSVQMPPAKTCTHSVELGFLCLIVK